jgi:hypothetical protein
MLLLFVARPTVEGRVECILTERRAAQPSGRNLLPERDVDKTGR